MLENIFFMSKATIKRIMLLLDKKDIIIRRQKKKIRNFQGVSYDMNEGYKDLLFKYYELTVDDELNIKKLEHLLIDNASPEMSPTQKMSPLKNSSYMLVGSSSSFKNKQTEKKDDETNESLRKISEGLSRTLDLGYWRNENLHPQKIIDLMDEIGLTSVNLMLDSLAHMAYQLEKSNNVDGNGDEIKSRWKYFSTALKKGGGFIERPGGYRSLREREIEREKERLRANIEMRRIEIDLANRIDKVDSERIEALIRIHPRLKLELHKGVNGSWIMKKNHAYRSEILRKYRMLETSGGIGALLDTHEEPPVNSIED